MIFPIDTQRHSCAHLLAAAIKELFPEAKFAGGPAIENGFYYDIDLPKTLAPEDLKTIQKKMEHLQKQNHSFERFAMPITEAITQLKTENQPYKIEFAQELKEKGETELSFYKSGNFTDMCAGPHVEKMSQIGVFKLDRIAGAYFRGDSTRPMLQRIYGLCFTTREELDAYETMMVEAKKRDHRILGKKLKMFTISELIGAGLPLMQPNGMIVRKAIEDYLWELHAGKGYHRVWTPHIAKEELYVTSGHAAKFGDELFRVQGKEEKFIMKPMNCPHHMQIFADNQFSYRDMPIRYFEPATVYRDEKSGQLSGLTRVRAITQDDGHLFCRVTQIKEEVKTIVSIIKEFYTTFGLMNDYWVSLSVRGEDTSKYLGGDEVWNLAESSLEEAAQENALNYKRVEGEAAFYGPKLDFMFKDSIGRQWQLATIQCDFNLPERFDLSFINEQGEKERPVVIHRAISGSLERFMGILIEHTAGRLPLWCAPQQVTILPVAEAFEDYARNVLKECITSGIRASVMSAEDSLGKRVRNAEEEKIPLILVVGEKEVTDKTISIRETNETLATSDFIAQLSQKLKERKNAW